MAIVHAAMFDAVNAIDHRYKPYLSSPRAKPWFSQDAAVATAAYRVLVDGDVVAEAQRAALRTDPHADLRRRDRQDPCREVQGRRRPRGRGRGLGHDLCAHRRRPLRRAGLPCPAPWAPRPGARRLAADLRRQRPRRVAEERRTVLRPQPRPLPVARAEPAHEPRLRARLRGGEAGRQERQRGAHQRSDRRGALLGHGQRGRHLDHVDPNARRQAPVVSGGPGSVLCADLPQHRRHGDRDVAGQGEVVVLAARHGDQRG